MNILVACEESQRVTTELRKLGHEAYSCDILDPSGGRPEWHIQQDVVPLLNGKCSFHTMDGVSHFIDKKWDLIIAFPPCTHLAVSGAMHFEKKRKDGRQREGIEFFCKILFCDCEKNSGRKSGRNHGRRKLFETAFSRNSRKIQSSQRTDTNHSAIRIRGAFKEENVSMAKGP